MDILRRNTDYALRAMANLARHYGQKAVSTREIAAAEDISYQLACKLMQKLSKTKLVGSRMGINGGFRLGRPPSQISLLNVIKTIQGPLKLNHCSLNPNMCARSKNCPVHRRLIPLQKYMNDYFDKTSLKSILNASKKRKAGNK